SKFLGKDSTDDSVRDHGHCKSVLEGKKASDNSQTSTVTSATLLARPFASQQSSDGVVSGYHKQASNLGQRALLSTLAFAAEHESGIVALTINIGYFSFNI
ncbi:zinc finger CCCH domain-containing protein, partial [Trifolium medium]|nr:zinc finger CCCH domain-containing protein [Trifolium medium]